MQIVFNSFIKQIRRLTNRIAVFAKTEPLLCAAIALSALLFASNVYKQGVVVNDELQWRFLEQSGGYKNIIKKTIEIETLNGRVALFMRVFVYLLTNNYYVNKTLYIICLLSNSLLFAGLVNKVFKNKYFAIFVGTISLLALPVFFNHTPPNAFVFLTVTPVFLTLVSLYLYALFWERQEKKYLALSAILFYLALSCFEFIIAAVPLYFMLALCVNNAKNYKESLWDSSVFALVAILFCAVYFGIRILYPSSYSGSQIKITSIALSGKVIVDLVKSSLPGYYFFREDSPYLFNLYANKIFTFQSYDSIQTILSGLSFKSVVSFLIVTILSLTCFNKFEKHIFSVKVFVGLTTTLFLFPMLNALSEQYQNWALTHICYGVPVNYPMFFLGVLLFAMLLQNIFTTSYAYKTARFAIISLLSIYIAGIQSMNSVFADKQWDNYCRLVTMENIFKTQALRTIYDNAVIYAPDLYRTMNSLGIHGGYWTQFAQNMGLNVTVNGKSGYNGEKTMIFDEGNDRFTIVNETHITSMSVNYMPDTIVVRTGIDAATVINTKGQYQDAGLFVVTKDLAEDKP